MPESNAEAKEVRPPKKVSLGDPPVYRGSGSYTESRKGYRDVQFAAPGSRRKPVDFVQVDSADVPQPFIDPTVFKQWQKKS
ncbi:hypothetical protein CPLU01_05549 [Colletotrichum plurivorum]|uniref:Uncharacterized protein n=1 Tax=Colletotrichum plurivorum TaxID=2175906 RepID=A0A8H6KLN2_9PEZI|nr:hypothetical protein CPLU01_05549 [Colletotrichum plurivorum]